MLHFFGWIEARAPGWTEDHVSAFVSIGGAFLGSAKAYAYPVTGEMTESIGLGAAFAAMLEKHGGLGRTSVAELTRTWASVPALLPRGGTNYWSTNGTFLTIEKPSPDVLGGAAARRSVKSPSPRRCSTASPMGRSLVSTARWTCCEPCCRPTVRLLSGEYEILRTRLAGPRRRRPLPREIL